MFDRHKLIIINHRKSKQWNVTIMKYRNSFAYVQRQINIILRKFRNFAIIYVNDIVVFFNFFEKHVKHFNKIFALFKRMNIVLKFIKRILNYFIIFLFEQRVDNLKLIIAVNKFEIIFNLTFSQIFKQFEKYLKKTNYLR